MITFETALPPNELSVLAGASGAGKSTLCVQALAAWRAGRTFLGLQPSTPLLAGYLVADRGIASLKQHASRDHIDFNLDHVLSIVDDEHISLTEFKAAPLQLLLHLLERFQRKGHSLIVIDPLMVFLGVDLNRYHHVAPPLIELNRFCAARHLTLLGIHHTTKARTDFAFLRPQDRISGSSALSAFTSTQWALWSPEELPEEQRSLGLTRLDIISHVAAPATLYLKRNQSGVFDARPQELPSTSTSSAESQVLDLLSKTPTPGRLVVELLDGKVSRASVYRALDSLSHAGVVTQPARGHYTLA